MSGYLPNIPTGNQTLKETQGPINTNFTVLNTAFGVDHTNFQTATNQGMHSKATLITGADPAAVTQGPILYSKSVGGKQEIFFIQSSNDGSAIVQLTDMQNAVSSAVTGSTFLPGGTLMKWGQVTTAANGLATITWNFPNNFFSAQLTRAVTVGGANNRNSLYFTATPGKSSGAIKLVDSGGSGFADQVLWVAIGN